MAIKKKDGRTYRLRGPNPIMTNQSFWEDEKVVVHDLDPKEVITKEGYEAQEEKPVEKYVPPPDKYESLEDIPVEEIKVPVIEISPPPEVKKRVVPADVEKEIVYVLPATIKESYDALYGESRSQITYGNKFTMEVVIANQTDLQLALWTNSTRANLESIVYVPKDKRWWKIADAYDKKDGHIMICVPSAIHPSFD